MNNSTVVILKSGSIHSVYAVGVVENIEPILDENRDFIEKFLSQATIVYSSAEKAWLMGCIEEELYIDNHGEPPANGIMKHTLETLFVRPLLLTVLKKK